MNKVIKRLGEFKQKQKGFTLVELIVVIAIIGILAAVMLPKYFGFTTDARKSAVLSEAKNIRSVADVYYAKNECWPSLITSSDPAGKKVGTDSPVFTGTFGGTLQTDGSFTYEKDGHEVICDPNGTLKIDH